MRPTFLVVPPLLLLAACAGDPDTGQASLALSGPGAGATAAPHQAFVPRPTIDDPNLLKGLSGRQITAALGPPQFTRRDAPAEIWQYRVLACTLDLFLYDDLIGQTVNHYAVRAAEMISDQDCLGKVQKAAPEVPAS